MLFFVPNINKEVLIWLVGLLHLTFLFHRAKPTQAAAEMCQRLKEKGVVPELYTFSRFSQPCAVYVKMKFPFLNQSGFAECGRDASFCYVGSTNITVAKREYNRVAKLRQLQNLKLPKTEIAIRYWHDTKTYEQYTTLLVSQHAEYCEAWSEEHSLIQKWQPKLNFPFVTKTLVRKAHGLVPKHQRPHLRQPPDTLGRQLFKKLRRRIQGRSKPLLNVMPQQAQFWTLIYNLASDTKQEYEASKQLRSGQFDNDTVTLMYRLANHMEQPWKSKVKQRLRRILMFRNASVPRTNKAIKVLFMAHQQYKKNVQKFITDLRRKHRHVLVPFHLPTNTVLEQAPNTLDKVLWNHKKKVTDCGRSWRPQQCSCQDFLRKHPNAQQHEGHVVTGIETLSMPKSCSVLKNIGASNAFFTTKSDIFRQTRQALQAWLKHHQFPVDDNILLDLDKFLRAEWTQHAAEIHNNPRLTKAILKHLLSLIPQEYIIHNEDHANAHLMLYCPNIYNQAAYNTWMDTSTFQCLDKTEEEMKAYMKANTPKSVSKHYGKLLDYSKPLPYGYIMMKRKKAWQKGRTIIAYSNTCVGKLLRITAIALQHVLHTTWTGHFGDTSSPEIWKEVHQLLAANDQPETCHRELLFFNHDLVGFFNSIPQQAIIDSVRLLIDEFLSRNNNKIIMVDPYKSAMPVHSGASKFSVKANMQKINVEHIVDIVQFSFNACAFTAIGEVFQQRCGTSMGNQISPILSTCAIVSTEMAWKRLFETHLLHAKVHHQFWIRRYVDNRAIIVDADTVANNPYIAQLTSLNFYKQPVQLEDENCDDFLGFVINANNRQVKYKLHQEPWRYRLPQSAGSKNLILSGYKSRKHLIAKATFPSEVTEQQLKELDKLYASLGFNILENKSECPTRYSNMLQL